MTRGGDVSQATRVNRQVVRLRHTLASDRVAGTSPPRLSQYKGQRYTFVEHLANAARVVQFRSLDQRDQRLFMLSVTDCGGRLKCVKTRHG